MAHLGLLCPAAASHLMVMGGLGHELQRRGHRVTLVCIPDAAPAAAAAGLGFAPIASEECPPGTAQAALEHIGSLSGLAAFRATFAQLQRSTALLLRDGPELLRGLGVDGLVVDQTSFAGPTLAEQLGLPFVSVCSALPLNADPAVPPFQFGWGPSPSRWARLRNRLAQRLTARLLSPIQAEIAAHRAAAGLPPLRRGADPHSRLAQICQLPPEFDFPRRSPPACLHYTGPLTVPAIRPEVPFPWDRLTGQPLFYASLGTIQNRQLDRFVTLAEACRHLDAQLVISLGGGCAPEDLPPLPGSPLVVGRAPQLELLKRAALTISHGGLNTVLESLAAGVPLVAIPIANDQPGVAARLAWSGAGAVVPLRQLTAPRLRAAIERVLADGEVRAQAQRLQAAIQRCGGVGRAADLIERALASGQPVLG